MGRPKVVESSENASARASLPHFPQVFTSHGYHMSPAEYLDGKFKIKQLHITLQKCDPALPRASAVHGPSDGAGRLDVLHGGEHGDAEHGDGGHEQHRDERQLDEGLPNADRISSSCLSRSHLLFNPGAQKKAQFSSNDPGKMH